MQCLSVTFCGLLASCLCSWASNVYFTVSQTPSKVVLKKGEQVQLTCSWNVNITGVKVRWFKDNQEVKLNQTSKFTETTNSDKGSATLLINDADRNDAGFYICEVTQDKPLLVKVNGTGTEICESKNATCMLTAENNSSPSSQQLSVPVLGASVSVAGVVLAVCVCLSVWRMKTSCKQSERMVIREGPPSEGEEQQNSEDGGSSRTSRGSTQWYMVPVYESYFDLQRSDEQECAKPDAAACASSDNADKDKQQEVTGNPG